MFGKQAVEKGKVAVLKNGIIAENYYFNEKIRNKYRNKLGWDDNYIIGHVGRFSTQKNHVFLIDIFKEIYNEMKLNYPINTEAVVLAGGGSDL